MRSIAYISDAERTANGGFNCKVTVQIGDRSDGRTFYKYVYTDQRFALLVQYLSGDPLGRYRFGYFLFFRNDDDIFSFQLVGIARTFKDFFQRGFQGRFFQSEINGRLVDQL